MVCRCTWGESDYNLSAVAGVLIPHFRENNQSFAAMVSTRRRRQSRIRLVQRESGGDDLELWLVLAESGVQDAHQPHGTKWLVDSERDSS
jgi:hypothetical protein